MKKYFYVLVLSVLLFLPTHSVLAEEATSTPDLATETAETIDTSTSTSTEEVIDTDTSTSTDETSSSTPSHFTIEGDVNVPATCTVTDTDGISHDFEATSTSAYIGICALVAATDDSLISGFEATNFSFGLFVTSINGLAADPSSQFWALYLNGDFPSVGLTDLPVAAGDSIELKLQDFSGNDIGDSLTLHIASLIATSTASTSSPQAATTTTATSTLPTDDSSNNTGDSSGGGGSGDTSHHTFDVEDAVNFLTVHQNTDGSFDSDMITDWVAIGLASVKSSTALSKIKTYMQTASPKISSVTDAERHAMALQALGINPYTGTGVDYIAPIVAAFDGTQIGDSGLDNDDIFALFPLLHAGYSSKDPIIQKTAAFILSRQKPDGSWDESPDMTAAAIDALGPLFDLPNVNTALGKGVGYLMSTQKSDGGWETIDSTSWVQTAINGILAAHTPGFDNESDFASGSGNTPADALADAQEGDGGVRPVSDSTNNRVWSTGYAILAASGKDWSFLLKSFSKPTQTTTTNSDSGGSGGAVAGTSTSTASTLATSTIQIAPLATSSIMNLLTVGTSTLSFVPTVEKQIVPAKPKAIASASVISNKAPALAKPTLVAQTASAASSGNIFSRAWHAVVSFFSHLFGL